MYDEDPWGEGKGGNFVNYFYPGTYDNLSISYYANGINFLKCKSVNWPTGYYSDYIA